MNDQNAKRDSGKVEITLVPMEMVEPPQGWSDEWEQVTMALRGKFA